MSIESLSWEAGAYASFMRLKNQITQNGIDPELMVGQMNAHFEGTGIRNQGNKFVQMVANASEQYAPKGTGVENSGQYTGRQ